MLKIKMKKYLTVLLAAAGMTASITLQAGSWDGGDWPKYKHGQVIDYLIITGNYESPRALAAVIQSETRNPLLLLPASGQPSEIFLVLPDGKVPAKVDPDQLSAYISGLNPKRILILGDASIVPPEYRLTINKKYEIVVFGNKSWKLNALAADNLFNTNKIQKKFEQRLAAAKKAEQDAKNAPQTNIVKAAPAENTQKTGKQENAAPAKPAENKENQPAPADNLDPLPENTAK